MRSCQSDCREPSIDDRPLGRGRFVMGPVANQPVEKRVPWLCQPCRCRETDWFLALPRRQWHAEWSFSTDRDALGSESMSEQGPSGLRKRDRLRAEALEAVGVNLDAQSGAIRDRQESVGVDGERLGRQFIDVGTRGEILDVAGDRNGG